MTIARLRWRSLAVVVWCAAAGGADAQLISRPVPPADAVERGQKAFVAACGFCHGATARGGESGPDLVRSPLVLDDENGSVIGPVLRQGRPEKGMPAFPMTQAQVSDIAAFLRARTQAAINRKAYSFQDVVTGDAKAGQAFFNGSGRCHSCHSATGDLAGIGKRYDPVALQSRLLHPAGGKAERTADVTDNGESVSGVIEYLDDFTVRVRDAAGDRHSWPRDRVTVTIHDPYSAHAELLQRYTDTEIHNVLAYLVSLQ